MKVKEISKYLTFDCRYAIINQKILIIAFFIAYIGCSESPVQPNTKPNAERSEEEVADSLFNLYGINIENAKSFITLKKEFSGDIQLFTGSKNAALWIGIYNNDGKIIKDNTFSVPDSVKGSNDSLTLLYLGYTKINAGHLMLFSMGSIEERYLMVLFNENRMTFYKKYFVENSKIPNFLSIAEWFNHSFIIDNQNNTRTMYSDSLGETYIFPKENSNNPDLNTVYLPPLEDEHFALVSDLEYLYFNVEESGITGFGGLNLGAYVYIKKSSIFSKKNIESTTLWDEYTYNIWEKRHEIIKEKFVKMTSKKVEKEFKGDIFTIKIEIEGWVEQEGELVPLSVNEMLFVNIKTGELM